MTFPRHFDTPVFGINRQINGEHMNRILSFALFFLGVSAVYFLMHFFVFKTAVKYIPVPDRTRTIVKYVFLFSGLSWPLGMLLSRWLHFTYLNHYAFVWLGMLSMAFFFLLIARLLNLVFPKQANGIVIGALVLVVLVSVYAFFNNLRAPVVKTISIAMEEIPPTMSGFRIVQLSDLHLDSDKSPDKIAGVVEAVNAIEPDLIVITGDFIDGDITSDRLFCDSLKKLKARHGIIAVTGNHEFYAGIDYFREFSEKLNITILRNEKKTVAGALEIVGIDDNEGSRFSGKGPDLDGALQGCDTSKPIILLRHRPEGFDRAVEMGVDLQISGHTHAGQIPPMDLLVYLFVRYPYGLYRKSGSYLYTSCGTGYWGPPMRLFSRAEIVEFVLLSPGAK